MLVGLTAVYIDVCLFTIVVCCGSLFLSFDSFNFYRAEQHGLGDHDSVCPFICLSITRMLCDETKEDTANILIPHERVIPLVVRYQQRLVGDVPF